MILPWLAITSVATAVLFAGLCAVFTLGYVVHGVRDFRDQPAVKISQISRAVPAAVVLSTAGTVYHFAAAGIPIMQDSVEVSRFELANSGLLGVPSRMYLYGTVVAVAMAVAGARQVGEEPRKNVWVRVSIMVLLGSRLLSGFKGGLIQVAFLVALIILMDSNGIPVRKHIRSFLVAGILSTVFVFAVGSTYGTYAKSDQSLTESLVTRATTGNTAAVVELLSVDSSQLRDTRRIVEMDWAYFLPRYFHLGSPTPYSFNRLFAARLYGIPPAPSAIIQPVTTGGYAEVYYDFRIFAWPMLFGLGFLLARIEAIGARRRGNPFGFALVCGVAQAIVSFLSKGSAVYMILNWSATLGIIFVWCFGAVAVAEQYAEKGGIRIRQLVNARRNIGSHR